VARLLVDTSVWISFLRDRDGQAGSRFQELVRRQPLDIIGCPAVRMELAVDPDDLRRHRVLSRYDGFDSTGIAADDFDTAADIYRSVRRLGHTVRSSTDCLIAAIAFRAGATLVHNDIDFERIAQVVTPLTVLRLPDAPD
jgi:predicted nucleic acid-binding protein